MTRYFRRFDRALRLQHLIVMISFLALSATGLPLLFSDAAWGRAIARLFGGFAGAGVVHRIFGAALLAVFLWHVATLTWRVAVKRERGLLWGPDSMMLQPRDALEFGQHVLYFIGLGGRPRFERFTYWEKFDYLAVLWGTPIMGLAGLVLWFPEAFARVLPGWMFNVALLVHGAEALLAIGFILIVHFFNGHLRPEKFPMDLVIFTGRVAEHDLREERAGHYGRLAALGALDALAAPPPTAAELSRARTIGSVGLLIGVVLVGMIVYAVLL